MKLPTQSELLGEFFDGMNVTLARLKSWIVSRYVPILDVQYVGGVLLGRELAIAAYVFETTDGHTHVYLCNMNKESL